MSTRERILDTALRLFNERGTGEVSTNHIAEACEISPGNLYYYFRNKQEIIRELFQRLDTTWENGPQLPQDRLPSLDDLSMVIEANYQIVWQYRFAYRELVALLRQDAKLHANFLAVRQRGFDGFREMFKAFVAGGVFREPGESQAVDELMEVCWLISEFWLTNLEINGRNVDEAEMQHGAKLMLRVLQPYLA
jgi:AcrR family transcriptional regulator